MAGAAKMYDQMNKYENKIKELAFDLKRVHTSGGWLNINA
jgi:hypothetical protein